MLRLKDKMEASVTYADSAGAVAWANVSGKPSTFTPASHTHTKSQITDFPTSLKNPTALTVQTNGTTAATYDGSAAKTVNITKSSVGLGSVDNTADSKKDVATAGAVRSGGTVTAKTGTALYDSGLRFHAGYNNGYPTPYGNSITLTASGSGELFCGWSGTEDESTHKTVIARLYYRNKRDTSSAAWSDWRTVAFTSDIPTSFAWGSISGKPSTFPPASHTHTKSQITDFPSSLKNPTALTVQGNGTTIATYDGSAAKTVNITKSSIGLGNVDNTADSAKSVNYAASAGAVAWGNVSGKPSTFTPASHEHDLSAMINKLSTGESTPTDNDYYVCQYAGGGTSTTSYHRRPVSALWSYIKSKTDSAYAAKSHTHSKSAVGLGNVDNTADSAKSVKYATTAGSANAVAWGNVSGKPSTFPPSSHTHSKSDVGLGNVDNTADSAKSVKYATSAGSASKLGSATVGSASTPIYLNGGTATACTYSFSASTTDLTAGSSPLATNEIRFIYE